MDGSSLRLAARASVTYLGAAADRDWNIPIPEMTWSVAETVAHMPRVVLWYAVDLAAGPRELDTMDLAVRASADPAQLVATLTTFATVLEHVIEGTPPGQRGWHPAGLADASGFAAMACDELLVHTYDAGRGLGVDFYPPPTLSGQVVRRLFPWAPDDVDPWRALLWANGRIALPSLPRKERWRPHPAPLSEWDGTAR